MQNIATTDTMINVMKDMTKILKLNEKNFDMKNINKTMGEFMMQMEKQEMMSGIKTNLFCCVNFSIEQINDIMDEDAAEIESDEETDKIINELEVQVRGGGGGTKEIKKDDVENFLWSNITISRL